MSDAHVKSHAHERRGLRLHPLPLRIMHWVNALAMIIMIGSGWKIYEDERLFGWLHFPDFMTIGGEAQGALQWHFVGMWILVVNGSATSSTASSPADSAEAASDSSAQVVAEINDALHSPLSTTT